MRTKHNAGVSADRTWGGRHGNKIEDITPRAQPDRRRLEAMDLKTIGRDMDSGPTRRRRKQREKAVRDVDVTTKPTR